MTAMAPNLLSVDEFIASAEEREGRWELVNGVPVAMAPERAAHVETKAATWAALSAAISRAKLPCRAMTDGLAVRITPRTAYEPDALVYCGPRIPPEAREVHDPILVVEVLSDSTAKRDTTRKLVGYFSVASVTHYLILDPEDRVAIHHKRGEGGRIETLVLQEGAFRLDPPGIELQVADLFPEA